MVGTPKNPPARHKTFGISDSLLDAARQVHEAGKGREDVKATQRNVARKSSALRSKDSVASTTTARFKQRHAGDTVSSRPGTEGQPRATGSKQSGSKRPVGGMGAVHYDLGNTPEDEFRRKYGKSKSAMRTGMRNEAQTYQSQSDYQYNKDSWLDSLKRVGKHGLEEEVINEESISVQMNAGGTTYKVLSVSADIGSRIKVGENLTDSHIDDLREMGISISYKGGKDGKAKTMEANDVDADSAAAARKHDCATHIKSEQFGEGVCVPTQHADPDENGQIEWYDVRFKHGIERVVTEKVAVVTSMVHSHKKKAKGKMITGSKMKEAADLDAKNVDKALKHDCASHVVHKEHGQGQCIPGQHTLVEKDEKVECKKCDGTGKIKGEICEHCNGKGVHAEGYVTHYDVMFKSGIKEDVPVEDLRIVKEMHHGHSKKKKMKEGADDNGDDDDNGNGKSKKKKKLDKVDKDELEGSHDDREDGDIDNDGDEDSSDKFLHKKRKAITKSMKKKNGNGNGDDDVEEEVKPSSKTSMFKEWVAMGNRRPGTAAVKDAMEAYNLAQHYLQLSNRDALFGREDKQKVNEELAKRFYEQYKDLKSKGDETADDTFKNEVADEKLESFKKTEMSQTTAEDKTSRAIKPQYNTDTHKLVVKKGGPVRVVPKDYQLQDDEYLAEALTKFGPSMDKHLADKEKDTFKAQGTIKMRKSDGDGIHGTTVNQKDTAKIAALKAKGYKIAESFGSEDILTFDSTDMPEHAPKVVEYIPHAYDYNQKSWMSALAEVNRYKGRSGHRVTKPEKEGPEHIVMQMRKVMSLGDNHQGVDFGDGTKKKVGKATAQKFLDKYSSSKPEEKEKLQRSAAHSHGGLHHSISDKDINKGPGQPKPSVFKPAARREPLRRLQHPDDQN